MRLGTIECGWRRIAAKHGILFVVAGLFLLSAGLLPVTRAQQQSGKPTSASGLAQQNLGRVAASAAEIKAVLSGDPGLMVELKRWVATDATEHGQIMSDIDLDNGAIFERLESDVQFRSLATELVQRYGYLLPRLNPGSDAAKEHESMLAERTKWLIQNQEQEMAKARQGGKPYVPAADSCNAPAGSDCDAAPAANPSAGDGNQEGQPAGTPFQMLPGEPNPSEFPSGAGNAWMRAQSSPSGSSLFNTLNVSATDPAQARTTGIQTGATSGTALARGISSERVRTDGLLAGYGNGMDGQGTSGPLASTASSPVSPAQPPNKSSASAALADPPEMARKASPYADIPSLYDMYIQAVSRPASPRRFGAEVFENGTRDSQLIPMDLPVGPDYVVGPGDGLSVDLWGSVSQRLFRIVDREGRVSLPEVGPILVSGKSLAGVQQSLQSILKTQLRDVSAEVSLSRLRTIRVYEVGDIARPGAYDISSLSTPLNALFVAGGPTGRGSMRILKHFRGTQLVQTVDIYDLLLHGVKTDLLRLENGDTVQVPTIGPQVTVEGMVRRPAVYELRDERNLAEVLELAGGLLPTAALRHIEVQRLVAHDKQTMLSLDVPEAEDHSAIAKTLESFEIRDGDRVRIFPITPYNQDTVFLEGHVARPGRYSYKADMRVTDIISSYRDLLPEPATRHAEIIRLNAPDFHPNIEAFDLGAALANPSQAPVLHPMDTIRVFSRFDFENPPSVTVGGEVREPGTFQTSGDVRLRDAIHLAGGLAPDAETEDAQVFRAMPDGELRIFSIRLSKALAGDPVENILLESRDQLLIHRNPNEVKPAAVYVQGEVARPGRYPLSADMRIADLVRIGGGFTLGAETEAADLTTYQWSNQQPGQPAPKDQKELMAHHERIALSSAIAGDAASNVLLHNGDVLTIRQLTGWNDLGASINLEGEVGHPGRYGIRPGERLSSVLERAGGFRSTAYPYGAILQRTQVIALQAKEQNNMLLRIKDAQNSLALLPDTDPKQKAAKDQAIQQWQASVNQLMSNPPVGRISIRISSNIERWKNTAADVEVRAGDTLIIPKRPGFVMVSGQVFNPTAVAYRPGKSASWYLSQSGGPTQLANKKAIFVIRADGSVMGSKNNLWVGESLGGSLQAGDTVIVPEKALSGNVQWQNILLSAQVASSIASTVFIALRY